MPLPVNPRGTQLGSLNAVLAGVGARYHVPDFEGCLSIKTVLSGAAVWQAGGRTFPIVEDQYLILNDRRRYSITIDSIERVRTFCLFFERGFVEDVFRATVTRCGATAGCAGRSDSARLFRASRNGRRCRGAADRRAARRYGFRAVARGMGGTFPLDRRGAGLAASERRERCGAGAGNARRHARRRFIDACCAAGISCFPIWAAAAPLKETAGAACLSPYHFHRAFTQRVWRDAARLPGTPPAGSRSGSCCGAARVALLKYVSTRGFESVASFSTLFRKRFGAPPGQFRKIR